MSLKLGGGTFHLVDDLTNGSTYLDGTHVLSGGTVQVLPGKICLLRTSFEGKPVDKQLVTSDGTIIPYLKLDDTVTRAGTIAFNYRFVMPDEDVFCNIE